MELDIFKWKGVSIVLFLHFVSFDCFEIPLLVKQLRTNDIPLVNKSEQPDIQLGLDESTLNTNTRGSVQKPVSETKNTDETRSLESNDFIESDKESVSEFKLFNGYRPLMRNFQPLIPASMIVRSHKKESGRIPVAYKLDFPVESSDRKQKKKIQRTRGKIQNLNNKSPRYKFVPDSKLAIFTFDSEIDYEESNTISVDDDNDEQLYMLMNRNSMSANEKSIFVKELHMEIFKSEIEKCIQNPSCLKEIFWWNWFNYIVRSDDVNVRRRRQKTLRRQKRGKLTNIVRISTDEDIE